MFKNSNVLVAGETGFVSVNINAVIHSMKKINNFDVIIIGSGIQSTIKNAEIIFNKDKPTMIPVRMLDVSKAKEKLGFEAAIRRRN